MNSWWKHNLRENIILTFQRLLGQITQTPLVKWKDSMTNHLNIIVSSKLPYFFNRLENYQLMIVFVEKILFNFSLSTGNASRKHGSILSGLPLKTILKCVRICFLNDFLILCSSMKWCFCSVNGIWAITLYFKNTYRQTDGKIFTSDPCSYCKTCFS